MSSVGPWRPDSDGTSSGSRPQPRWARSRPSRPGPASENTLESPIVRSRLSGRIRVAEGLSILLVTLLLFSFWRLQVVHAEHYRELAENNMRRNIVVRAPRGLMTDRHGTLLAANRPAFNVAIIRENVVDLDATMEWVALVLGQTADELRAHLDRQRNRPVFQPIVVADDIEPQLVAAIEARSREFPGVIIEPEHKRYYPEGTLAAHLLGHVGEISREQLDSWDRERFRMGDIIGRNGVERVHNDALSGWAGAEALIVNNTGRTVRVLSQTAPEPGMTLTLTLDLRLQRHVERLLEDKKGAVAVLDVKTGGVLALASAPTFDPNFFAGRFTQNEWDALLNDPAKPLQNRALQSAYPPGSIFKLIMAVAGLEEGVITEDTTMFCRGGGTYFGQFRACNVPGGHGTVNLRSAIGRSCNVYFYEVGAKIGREKILEVAQRFGLGERTGIDLLDERRGTLPTDAWLGQDRNHPNGVWYPGETIGLSIGQGPIDTTPLQLAHMVATLAGGLDITPHIVMREQDASGRLRPTQHEVPRTNVNLSPYHQQLILDGMWAVVNNNGSGWRARDPNLPIGGKTGTAQVASFDVAGPEADRPEHLRNHAWFVGLAPAADPEVAIAVFVEHGGGGGAVAAPLGGAILSAYFADREISQ